MRWVRWLLSWPRGWWGDLSYWVRPYDPVADARRWRWRARVQCGSEWAYRNPEAAEAIARAIAEREGWS